MIELFRKTLNFVDRSTRWQAVGIVVLIVVAVGVETLGIGLIYPFIKLIVDPAEIQNMPWLGRLLGGGEAEVGHRVLIQLTLGLICLWVLKNTVLLVIYYVQARFSLYNMRLLSLRLYRQYLGGPYFLHLARNSADLIRNIHFACASAFLGSFMGFLTLASEALIMVAIAVLLIVIDPAITLSAGLIIGAAVGLFYLTFRRHVLSWGERHIESVKLILKSLQQGLGSIKEIKVLGREEFLVDDFKVPLGEYVHVTTVKQLMAQAPRLWIETVTVVGVLGVVVFALAHGGSMTSLLAVLSVFGAAALRLIPSMNRILIALNRINDAKHSVDMIHRDIVAPEAREGRGGDGAGVALSFSRALEVRNLSYRFPGAEAAALNDVSFTLRPGESLGLVGPSGAGKSTLVDIILGLLEPTAGKVVVDGVDIATNVRAWRKYIGYVPQAIYLIDDTLRRNIALGLQDAEIDDARIDHAIGLAQLEDLVRKLPSGLDTNVGENGVRLSGGQRQRVGIARALYCDPRILVLDEATSALDSETEHEITRAIERLSGDKTLIIIAHRLSTVRRCDHLIFLEGGCVSGNGTFDQLTADNSTFRNLVELSKL